jgi:ribonuclease VapC
MVVDTSAILAVLFDEQHGLWAAEHLTEHAAELCMSTVDLTEALIILRDRQPVLADELQDRLLATGIAFVPPDVQQAEVAADARLRSPLNLGDCFAYALAVARDDCLLAADSDFSCIDRPVHLP